jgi:hypothetical protein
MMPEMVVNTFAHPYGTQLVAFWLSLLPIAGIATLMAASLLRGDRGRVRLTHIRVPGLHRQ